MSLALRDSRDQGQFGSSVVAAATKGDGDGLAGIRCRQTCVDLVQPDYVLPFDMRDDII